jgi:hypothetical protein
VKFRERIEAAFQSFEHIFLVTQAFRANQSVRFPSRQHEARGFNRWRERAFVPALAARSRRGSGASWRASHPCDCRCLTAFSPFVNMFTISALASALKY